MTSRKLRILALLLPVLLLLAEPCRAVEKTIRVGYFPYGGFYETDHTGERSGYGYELLQMLRLYTNWKYEYIGHPLGVPALRTMLKQGEIDLMPSAFIEKQERGFYDFSDIPIGYFSIQLSVRAGQTKFLREDYAHWNGIRVGMLTQSDKNESFLEFARAKKFTFQRVDFDHIHDMFAALQAGKIDAQVTNGMRYAKDEWVYENLLRYPCYMAIPKNNPQLLRELNAALRELESENFGFRGELYKKYYDTPTTVTTSPTLSLRDEERKFIADAVAKGTEFQVLVNPDRDPISFFHKGAFRGVLADAMQEWSARTGLKFKVIPIRTRDEYYKILHEKRCDIVLDFRCDFPHLKNWAIWSRAPI